jgi:alginate O-acetyltransferase complex protein AlgI
MLFNSFTFIFFLAATLFFYYLLPHRFRWILLLIASFYFYMFFIPVYVFILIFLILLDYFCAICIEKAANKKRILLLSLIGNLSILVFFKYWNFLNDNLNSVLHIFGKSTAMPWLAIALPVGLSFHTFQSMSYTIDVYKGKLKAERHLGYYALFVMFFPQLVAGPIERATTLLHQLKTKVVSLNYLNIIHGLSFITRGLFKKIVIADQLAGYVNAVYDNYQVNSGFTVVLATWFFAIQIYCDFSGYSDIATGAAKMLGYDMSLNFNMPYFSKSVTEFWRRWHISLSAWLRDYLYIPLGGSKKGKVRTYLNLFITMLLGGLWHGSSWNFVIWGGLNGFYLSIEKMFNVKTKLSENYLFRFLKVFFVFNLISLSWVFFRSETIAQSLGLLKNISVNFWSLSIKDTSVFINCIFSICSLLLFEFLIYRKYSIEHFISQSKLKPLYALNFISIILILLFAVNSGAQFIYFQF